MRYVLLAAFVVALACPAAADPYKSSSERMQADVGKPLSYPIIRNGPPESIVRINSRQVAVTFVKRDSVTTGGGITTIPVYNGFPTIIGHPVENYTIECRFTLIVEAPRDNMPTHKMTVSGFMPPKPECER